MQWKTIGLGKKHGGLYILNNPILINFQSHFSFPLSCLLFLSYPGFYSSQASSAECLSFASCNNVDVSNKSVLWHNRLGHPSFSRKHSITTSASMYLFLFQSFQCVLFVLLQNKRDFLFLMKIMFIPQCLILFTVIFEVPSLYLL